MKFRIRSLALACVLLAAAPLVALAKPARAPSRHDGAPSLDARDETVLIGAAAPAGEPKTLDQQGTWQLQSRQVERTAGSESTAWWLAGAQEARMQDGFVRARLPVAGGATALMLRAHAERKQDGKNQLAAIAGYGVTFEKGRVDVRRYDGPAAKSLLAGVAVGETSEEVEITAWMVGPHLHVEVMNGKTFDVLATLSVSDATYPEGSCGLRLGGKHAGKLTWLSVRPAGRTLPPRPGAMGPLRYLQVALNQADRCGPLPACKVVDKNGDAAILQVDAAGFEALKRQLPSYTELFLDEPRGLVDPTFRSASRQPPVATDTGFALDRSYKDAPMVEALLRGYAQRYPKLTQLVQVGQTTQGRPQWALRIHAGTQPADSVPQVLINGAHHGVELAALEAALDACGQLVEGYGRDPQVTTWAEQTTIWCVPLVNPDGNYSYLHVSRHGGRKNGRDTDGNGRVDPSDGVDLNRNYPFRWHTLGEVASNGDPRRAWYRGPRAASEPEVQGMMQLNDAEHFVASVSYHTQANAILVPYTIPEANDPEPNEAWDVAKVMAERAGRQISGKPLQVRRRLYAVDGVDQDWHRAAHGTTAFLVEMTKTNPGLDALHKMVSATRGTWQALLDRVVSGPGVRGRLVDAQGQPVVAEVRVRQVKLRDGERWTSRCRDGRFDRLLPGPGQYTLEVVDPQGKIVASRAIDVGQAGTPAAIVQLDWTVSTASAKTSCSRPDLCAVDSWCEGQAGRCVAVGPGRWCRIDGQCVERGQKSPGGVCRPDQDPWGWSQG